MLSMVSLERRTSKGHRGNTELYKWKWVQHFVNNLHQKGPSPVSSTLLESISGDGLDRITYIRRKLLQYLWPERPPGPADEMVSDRAGHLTTRLREGVSARPASHIPSLPLTLGTTPID